VAGPSPSGSRINRDRSRMARECVLVRRVTVNVGVPRQRSAE
jgi:hypothetical protein